MRARWMACSVLALLAGCDLEATLRGPTREPLEAAQQGLALLATVVDNESYREAGFDSVDQARNAVLGMPVDVYVLRFDSLVQWNGQEDMDALVLAQKSVEVVYPVMVGRQVKSTVSIFKQREGYRPATFGDAEIARTLARYRQSDADFIVRVPAFGMYFVGRKSDNGVSLTPVRKSTFLPKLQPGEPVRSSDVVPPLADLAKRDRSRTDFPM